MKKKEVVAGKKLTCLSFEILKIGRQEAEIRRGKDWRGKSLGRTRIYRRRTSKTIFCKSVFLSENLSFSRVNLLYFILPFLRSFSRSSKAKSWYFVSQFLNAGIS